MSRRRHTPEQIIRKLAEGQKLLAGGMDLEGVCRQLEIAESTWARWLAQYGGMKADDAKRLKELSSSYDPLLKSLLPLAERRPDDRLLDRVPGRRSSDEDRFRFVGNLVAEMRSGIGEALGAVNDDRTIVLPAHEMKSLESVVASA